jgi:hypothetical protein
LASTNGWAFAALLAAAALVDIRAYAEGGRWWEPGFITFKKAKAAVADFSRSKVRSVNTAITTAYKYGKAAYFDGYPELGFAPNSDEAHQWASYQWGYEVKDVQVVTAIRSYNEVMQFIGYTHVNSMAGGAKKSLVDAGVSYDTLTSNYAQDVVNDVQNAIKGAKDANAGKPPDPSFIK